jgi:hypothetical protein
MDTIDVSKLDSRCLISGKGLNSIRTPMGNASLAYCYFCGSNKRRSIAGGEGLTHVFYVCPQCSEDHAGKIPGIMVPGTEKL